MDLHIYADYRPTNVPSTSIPIDTIFNPDFNVEDDEDDHKYTNGWYMMRLDEKMGNFVVNSNIPFDDVARLEVFIEDEEEGENDWDVSTDL